MKAFVIPVIVSILILGAFSYSQDAFATGGTISDQTSCEDIGGTWISPDTCLLDFTINDGETLNISSGVILNNTGGTINIESGGTLNNDGTLNITFDSSPGSVSRFFIWSDGTLNNIGIINVGTGYLLGAREGSTLNNIGTINVGFRGIFITAGQFDNSGTLNISKDSSVGSIDIRSPGAFFDNSGTININKLLRISGDHVVSGGTINISQDALLEFSDGTIIGPDQVICGDGTTLNTVTNECEADVTQAQLDAAESIIAVLKLLIANISVAFVQPIIDAVNDITIISDDASLTRTFERSLSTLERADGVACKGATGFVDDVNALLADGIIDQGEADTLLDRANDLLATCTP